MSEVKAIEQLIEVVTGEVVKREVCNLSEIVKILNDGLVYRIDIVSRKKETKVRDIKQRFYYVTSVKELGDLYPTIKAVCKETNARAYITVNGKDLETHASVTAIVIQEMVLTGRAHKFFDAPKEAFFDERNADMSNFRVIDFDSEELESFLTKLKEMIKEVGFGEIVTYYPTVNNYHVIIKKCRMDRVIALMSEFGLVYDPAIKTTLLYY